MSFGVKDPFTSTGTHSLDGAAVANSEKRELKLSGLAPRIAMFLSRSSLLGAISHRQKEEIKVAVSH